MHDCEQRVHGEGDDGREESTGTILLGKALALVCVRNIAVTSRARDVGIGEERNGVHNVHIGRAAGANRVELSVVAEESLAAFRKRAVAVAVAVVCDFRAINSAVARHTARTARQLGAAGNGVVALGDGIEGIVESSTAGGR